MSPYGKLRVKGIIRKIKQVNDSCFIENPENEHGSNVANTTCTCSIYRTNAIVSRSHLAILVDDLFPAERQLAGHLFLLPGARVSPLSHFLRVAETVTDGAVRSDHSLQTARDGHGIRRRRHGTARNQTQKAQDGHGIRRRRHGTGTESDADGTGRTRNPTDYCLVVKRRVICRSRWYLRLLEVR